MQGKASSGIIFALLLSILMLAVVSVLITNASAWSNGGYSNDPANPDYGTHDWIAQHALDWLPTHEKQYILDNLAAYLYGTELPDNNQAPEGIGDTTKHHIYYNSAEVMTDDAAAVRASAEYDNARNFIISKDVTRAAKNAGIMSHYIVDMTVFSHVMGSGTDWGAEVHHSDYETHTNSHTSSYSSDFASHLSFDGSLTTLSAYNAAKNLAYDTTFDVNGDLTCVWMDQNYDWNNPTFKNRAGESLNLAVNYLTDVLHTLYWASVPDQFYITTVPHHPQINSYYCGPASLEMVFDFYGPDVPQPEIADAARTIAYEGTYTCDMLRAAHFSNLSTSVGEEMPTDITGYTARKLGYGAFEYWGMTLNELKHLIAAGYPIIVCITNHFRVAVGYSTTHFTFQDSLVGRMINVTTTQFDSEWDYSSHWALFVSPWQTEVFAPQQIVVGSVFDITANITYPLPPPFYTDEYPASSSNATLILPSGLSLSQGETAKKTIDTGNLAAGKSTNVKWKVSAKEHGNHIVRVETEGKVEGFMPALPEYPWSYTYTDRIGGAQQTTINVVPEETPPVTVDDYDGLWHTEDFTITLTATDSQSGVAGTYYKINDGTVETVSANEQPIITTESAVNKLEYWSVDNDGNEEDHHILTGIKLDKTAPSGTITINNGEAYATSTSVMLTLTTTDATSGTYQVRYSNDGIWDTEQWEMPSPSKTWTLTSEEGTKTVYYKIKDNAGLTSAAYSATIILDGTPPTGLITINEGATYVTTVTVTLSPYATDATSGIAEMRFSNDNTTYTEWQTYTTPKPWTLPNSDGTRTVYVQFKDNSGLVSKTYTDTIILDTTRPTGSIKIAEDATYTNSLSVVLTLSAEDATSGIATMRFSNDTTTWTPWETYSTSETWTLTAQDETKKVYAQFRDKAGLTSQTSSDAIILDATPPTIRIKEPSQGSETESSIVTVTWTSSDETSKIDKHEIRLDEGKWTDIETDTTYTFSGLADGTHTVDVRATDKAGNTKQETISFTINTSPLFGLNYNELTVIIVVIIGAAIGTGALFLKIRKKK